MAPMTAETVSAPRPRPHPFRDLPWLAGLVLRAAPVPTVLWAILSLTNAVLVALGLWTMRGAVNALVRFGPAAHRGMAIPWLVGMAGVFAANEASQTVLPYVRLRVRVAAGFALQQAAMGKLGRLPVEAFEVDRTHDLIRRVAEGADSRGPDLVGEALGLAQAVPSLAANAVALGLINPWVPVVLVCTEFLLVRQFMRQGARRRAFEVEQTRPRRLASYYAGMLTARQHAAEVRLWGLRDEILRRWRRGQSGYVTAKFGVALRNAAAGTPGSAAFVVIMAGTPVAITLFGGQVQPGNAALMMTALMALVGGLSALLGSSSRFVEHAGYATDVRQLLERVEPEEPDAAPWLAFPRPMRQGIRLQGVEYRYPGASVPALSALDAEIGRGEVVALVGANGAGKTTLASLLLGLRRPTAGTVLVDGGDLCRVRPSEVRAACTAVFQQPVRYPATMRENLVPASAVGNAIDLLRVVGLSERAAEGGPESDPLLGPEFGGTDLSGGQWQRLAIARALARTEAEIAVFDEPTAALDPLAELELFERFAQLAAGRTTILVSHRLGPTRLADRVLVLEGGLLVEQGSPRDLLAAGGLFARMFEAQAEWYR